MKKSYRYILYLCIGAALYYVIGADDNPEVLKEFHGYAPLVILGVVILLFVVRYITSRKNRGED